MKSTRNIFRIYTLSLLTVTLLLILLRSLDLFFFFDREIGYYQRGALLPIAETVLLFASPLSLLTAALLWLRHIPVRYGETNPLPLRLSALLTSLFSLIFVVLSLWDQSEGFSLANRVLLIGAMITAVYFLLTAGKTALPLLPRFLTGVGAVVFLLFALGSAYFDATVPMNAPDKLLFLIACLFAMLFTAEELRVYAEVPKSGRYFFSLGCAVFFLGVSSIPTLIGVSFGAMEPAFWHPSCIVLFGIFLYALTRLLLLLFTTEKPEENSAEPPVEDEE